ncbi:protein activator of alkane oxidation PraB [Caulobacter sp. 602-2]|uniref:Protein activator of alkane oxidation PraB n=1 Tax=Caulobacter sp. 602-2 TaxID=2710887 RepID=A0A6G4R2M7_9CAUL|nr:protein activator of alkane oxidation PraB [Caulobacter sp. 602-2]NGM51824.1 protein activator of alkane oxidation PraB [Caulobacter sp. 602-2]
MFKRATVASAFALAVAGLTAPTQVFAQTFTPTFPGYVTLTGNVTIAEATTLNCQVTLNGAVNPTGASITITSGSFSSGDWQCGWLIYPVAFPWTITPSGAHAITLTGVALVTTLGACSGSAHASWNNPYVWPTSIVRFSSTPVAGLPVDCRLTGDLVVSDGVTLQ